MSSARTATCSARGDVAARRRSPLGLRAFVRCRRWVCGHALPVGAGALAAASPAGREMSSLVSIRSIRCNRADSVSLADGSSSRAHMTSRAVAGRSRRASPPGRCAPPLRTGPRRRPDAGSLISHPIEHVIGRIHDATARRIRNRLQHNEIAEPFQQIGSEPARIVPGVDYLLHRPEQCRPVTGSQH